MAGWASVRVGECAYVRVELYEKSEGGGGENTVSKNLEECVCAWQIMCGLTPNTEHRLRPINKSTLSCNYFFLFLFLFLYFYLYIIFFINNIVYVTHCKGRSRATYTQRERESVCVTQIQPLDKMY